MYTCINQGCPDAGAPLMQCKPEYHGPLCAICKERHFERLGSCVKCEGLQLGASTALFISMLLLVVCGRLLYRYRTVVHAMNVGANLKIIVSFLTVLSTINKQFGVTWPVINHSTRTSTILGSKAFLSRFVHSLACACHFIHMDPGRIQSSISNARGDFF
jgi:hypothetical protein